MLMEAGVTEATIKDYLNYKSANTDPENPHSDNYAYVHRLFISATHMHIPRNKSTKLQERGYSNNTFKVKHT